MKKILCLMVLLSFGMAGCATVPSPKKAAEEPVRGFVIYKPIKEPKVPVVYGKVTDEKLLAEYADLESQIQAESKKKGAQQKIKTLIAWRDDLLEEIRKRGLSSQ